jgi:hypothetical protein
MGGKGRGGERQKKRKKQTSGEKGREEKEKEKKNYIRIYREHSKINTKKPSYSILKMGIIPKIHKWHIGT